MNRKLRALTKTYLAGLRDYLAHGKRSALSQAQGLGERAVAAGLDPQTLSQQHDHFLVTKVLRGCSASRRRGLIRRAGNFLAVATTPVKANGRGSWLSLSYSKRLIAALSQRTVQLESSNLALTQEIKQRKAVEEALQRSERHYSRLLRQSDHLQDQLRRLSRQILWAQEEERKRISRELHDVIAQTLTSINVRLAVLKRDAALNTRSLERNIVQTQRMVEDSVNIVHRFARELRPAVLDDLGLIPALQSFLKSFASRTGLQTRLTSVAGIERIEIGKRTVLYRVAQEALTNVARHAKARRVNVRIRQTAAEVCLQVMDDGRSFNVKRLLESHGGTHLGLLGMKERLEMVGGSFLAESTPGKGTTITARIPLAPPPVSPKR